MKLKYLFIVAVLVGLVWACSEDDDTNVVTLPLRDRAEQQAEDKVSLIDYLSTHYYNASDFQADQNYSIDQIEIIKAELDENDVPIVPEGSRLLISDVETLTSDYFDVEYEYYILKLNQGGGEASPNFTDKVRVVYEGSLPSDGFVFDAATAPTDFNLVGGTVATVGTIVGWQRTLPEFNVAENFEIDGSGIVNFNNYGFGVIFLPSGLGYFGNPPVNSGIPDYANLVFKFELYQTEENDHDADLVPSHAEDLNNNLDPFDDDTDEDGRPNYLDLDDDGDGVLTRNEDIDGDGDPTNDIGVNGIPKYLDPEETESNIDS
jgi:hypothetical protein